MQISCAENPCKDAEDLSGLDKYEYYKEKWDNRNLQSYEFYYVLIGNDGKSEERKVLVSNGEYFTTLVITDNNYENKMESLASHLEPTIEFFFALAELEVTYTDDEDLDIGYECEQYFPNNLTFNVVDEDGFKGFQVFNFKKHITR